MAEAIRRRRRVKIVATIGPASSSPERLEELFRAGADVFRLNFSHGTQDDHAAVVERIRHIEKKTGRRLNPRSMVLQNLERVAAECGDEEAVSAAAKAGHEAAQAAAAKITPPAAAASTVALPSSSAEPAKPLVRKLFDAFKSKVFR